MADPDRKPLDEQIEAAYEQAEGQLARAMEQFVGRDAFGEMLARLTENVAAISKLGTDTFDLVLRNLRLAGRRDVTSLARQLARTEDKLEQVLQQLEQVHEEVARQTAAPRTSQQDPRPVNGRSAGGSARKRSR